MCIGGGGMMKKRRELGGRYGWNRRREEKDVNILSS